MFGDDCEASDFLLSSSSLHCVTEFPKNAGNSLHQKC